MATADKTPKPQPIIIVPRSAAMCETDEDARMRALVFESVVALLDNGATVDVELE